MSAALCVVNVRRGITRRVTCTIGRARRYTSERRQATSTRQSHCAHGRRRCSCDFDVGLYLQTGVVLGRAVDCGGGGGSHKENAVITGASRLSLRRCNWIGVMSRLNSYERAFIGLIDRTAQFAIVGTTVTCVNRPERPAVPCEILSLGLA